MTGGIVLAAGGTGGHLFPAQALGAELLRRGHEVALITDRRGHGYEDRFEGIAVHRVPAASPTGAGIFGQFLAMTELARGTFAARRLLKTLRPRAVVGFGGYPSLPTLWAATRAGLPSLVHEQNALLGRVNRLLARRVDAIALSHAQTAGLPPDLRAEVAVTGNPVRAPILAVREVSYAPPGSDGPIRLLILGGSQGARILSQVVPAALAALPPGLRRRLDVTQQCRAEDLPSVRQAYGESGIAAALSPFIEDVPARLAATHLCITRAGAGTVAELTVAGRPAVLVPYLHAADDHQSANAKALAAAGAASLLPQAEFTPETLARRLEGLLGEPAALTAMAQAARALGRPQATHALADLVTRIAIGSTCTNPAGGAAGAAGAAAAGGARLGRNAA